MCDTARYYVVDGPGSCKYSLLTVLLVLPRGVFAAGAPNVLEIVVRVVGAFHTQKACRMLV